MLKINVELSVKIVKHKNQILSSLCLTISFVNIVRGTDSVSFMYHTAHLSNEKLTFGNDVGAIICTEINEDFF